MSLASGTPIGKYVVRRKIAEGGMAEIYLASSRGPEGFEKEVVIKRVRSFLATDESFVQMFVAEARVASRLNHANLVQIFDFDKHDDTYYLAMEYVRGHSLWDVRKRARERMEPMPPVLVAQIGAEVAKGLHHAHHATEKGKPLNLVHRDVTPHNVLLSYEGAVKLTDFGVAKAGNRQTAAGVLKGKFAYMSPEQASGGEVDPRTDIFALGIVLWEMLTGARLFDGDSDVQVLRAVQTSAIAPPARLNSEIHPDLDAVVMKALEREPAKRYQTAQELAFALAQFVMRHAKTLEDTDVGAYLRKLFADEWAGHPDGRDSTASQKVIVEESVSEGTANLRMPAQALSPDEDVNAATYVVDRKSRGTAVKGATPPRAQAALAEAPRPSPVAAPVIPPPSAERPSSGTRSSAVARAERTVGMRRGLIAGGGTFVVVAAMIFYVSWTRRSRLEPAAANPPTSASIVGKQSQPHDPMPTSPSAPQPAESTPRPQQVEPSKRAVAVETSHPSDAVAPAPKTDSTTRAVPTSTSAPSSTERNAEAATGQLVVNVMPWATIWIDSHRKGEVYGRKVFKLAPGTHAVRLEHSATVKKQNVEIEAGKSFPLEISFLPKP